MSLSKANILTLASGLALDLETDATLSTFFDDVVEQLSLIDNPPFTDGALVELTSGTATYDFESTMLKLIFAIMEDSSLSMTHEEGLEAYSKTWRSDTGTPFAVTQDWLSRQYTLYPNPNFNSTPLAGGATEPLGEDYPDDNLWIVFAEDRSTSIQDYYGLVIALLALAREFSQSSDHIDLELAASANQLGSFIMLLLGH